MAKYKQLAASGLVKTGFGKVMGMFCSASSSLVAQLVDGVNDNDDAANAATGVLTSSGACAPADFATATLTSDATNPDDGDTVTINATVYRFKNTTAQAYDVKIGANAAATLDNLKLAINATGVGDGTDYHTGTLVHPNVIATTNTDTTQVIRSRTYGTTANSWATTETSGHLSWDGATMSGGVATSAATITIGSVTYTVTKTLSESIGITAAPNEVLWATNEATFLDNLKSAINASAGEGTTYGTGTVAHPTVNATTNTDTAQTIEADTAGAAGNSIATTETLANYAWGGATLSGGLDGQAEIIEEFPLVAGTFYPFSIKDGLSFDTGLYYRLISGTGEVTIEYE